MILTKRNGAEGVDFLVKKTFDSYALLPASYSESTNHLTHYINPWLTISLVLHKPMNKTYFLKNN